MGLLWFGTPRVLEREGNWLEEEGALVTPHLHNSPPAMGSGPAQRSWAGGPGGDTGQNYTFVKEKRGLGLSIQKHLLSPQVAWEETQDITFICCECIQLLWSLNE